jgi:hypothetical protein
MQPWPEADLRSYPASNANKIQREKKNFQRRCYHQVEIMHINQTIINQTITYDDHHHQIEGDGEINSEVLKVGRHADVNCVAMILLTRVVIL